VNIIDDAGMLPIVTAPAAATTTQGRFDIRPGLTSTAVARCMQTLPELKTPCA